MVSTSLFIVFISTFSGTLLIALDLLKIGFFKIENGLSLFLQNRANKFSAKALKKLSLTKRMLAGVSKAQVELSCYTCFEVFPLRLALLRICFQSEFSDLGRVNFLYARYAIAAIMNEIK